MANGHGGKRPGAGRKPKPLAEKLLDGNPGKRRPVVMNLPEDNIAPKECPEYLSEFAFLDIEMSVEEIYEQTVKWLEGTGCLHLINPAFITEYALLKNRWMECEFMVGQHPVLTNAGSGTGIAVNPMADIGLKYLKSANEVWGKIWEIVAQNSASYFGDDPNQDIMAVLIKSKPGR